MQKTTQRKFKTTTHHNQTLPLPGNRNCNNVTNRRKKKRRRKEEENFKKQKIKIRTEKVYTMGGYTHSDTVSQPEQVLAHPNPVNREHPRQHFWQVARSFSCMRECGNLRLEPKLLPQLLIV